MPVSLQNFFFWERLFPASSRPAYILTVSGDCAATATLASLLKEDLASGGPTYNTLWPLPRGVMRSMAGTPTLTNSSMGAICACSRPSWKIL